MRISKNQLQQIIDEEISRSLLQAQNRRLTESVHLGTVDSGHGSLYDADVSELLEFAKSYASLGIHVQEQLDDLLDRQEDAEVNTNAVQLIEDRLGGMNAEIDEVINTWMSGGADSR
jgi:hypothetical protein